MERHPDFDDIRNSDDFHTWASNLILAMDI